MLLWTTTLTPPPSGQLAVNWDKTELLTALETMLLLD